MTTTDPMGRLWEALGSFIGTCWFVALPVVLWIGWKLLVGILEYQEHRAWIRSPEYARRQEAAEEQRRREAVAAHAAANRAEHELWNSQFAALGGRPVLCKCHGEPKSTYLDIGSRLLRGAVGGLVPPR